MSNLARIHLSKRQRTLLIPVENIPFRALDVYFSLMEILDAKPTIDALNQHLTRIDGLQHVSENAIALAIGLLLSEWSEELSQNDVEVLVGYFNRLNYRITYDRELKVFLPKPLITVPPIVRAVTPNTDNIH